MLCVYDCMFNPMFSELANQPILIVSYIQHCFVSLALAERRSPDLHRRTQLREDSSTIGYG